MSVINVNSEIKPLKKVLLHRPGNELINLTPDLLDELLFDDIPSIEDAQKEHDNFVKIFKDNGVEVVYLEDLMAEVLESREDIKEDFIKQVIEESRINNINKEEVLKYLNTFDSKELVLKVMSGISVKEILDNGYKFNIKDKNHLFVIFPMPNLYFTRDVFSSIGDNVILNTMYTTTRFREGIFGEYIFKYHPEYKNTNTLYGRKKDFHIEGGDITVINDELLIVGISQRTEKDAVKELAKEIFSRKDNKIKNIIAILIPDKRTFMHLDTVLTQIDYDAFLIHPEIFETLELFNLTLKNGNINIEKLDDNLQNVLSKYMNQDIKFFNCGGDNIIDSQREQWSDGSNSVALAPGKIIVYKRNYITNKILKEAGYELLELDGINLGVGRGGPRCMSMPLVRE